MLAIGFGTIRRRQRSDRGAKRYRVGRLLILIDGFHRGNRESSSPAFGAEGELVVMQAASELGFLEMSRNMFIWHLLHAGFYQVGFLRER